MIQVLILLLLQQAEKVSAAWLVTFENPDICALRGSSAEFRCSYNYPDEESVRQTAWDKGMIQNGVLERVRLSGLPSYYGRYEYQDKFGRRSKKSVYLSVTGLEASVRPNRVRLGDSVTLDCRTECQNTKIIWFRDGRPVAEPTFKAQITDTGNYSCAFEGIESSQSDPVALDVWYPPLNVSVEVNRSDPLLVGSSVTLTCRGSARPAAITYTWWHSSNGSNSSTEVGSGQVLSISSVELTHTGTYVCQAENRVGQSRSAELLLTVEETVHPLIVLGIGIKVIILLVLPPVLIWVWKCRSHSDAKNEENTSNDYENVIFG
ncbi:B-cell receptor CD22-like isoform X3 [Poecilia reticulata]|uniref:B-cell receptor CD22-like isoform X3 n=1 Tax=Poecilia reticulata TaxID=8081 RepID=UPI0004A2EE95|nr:PREDICTED: B-cell receptor CD22-like isoform X3 [Poecilia reticulata]